MTTTRRRQPPRGWSACQASLNSVPILHMGRRMKPNIKVYTWTTSTRITIGSMNVTPAADMPHDAGILCIELDAGLMQGAVAAGAHTTWPGKPTISRPTTHRQGTPEKATHTLGVGPEEQMGMDTSLDPHTTPTTTAMRNITQQRALVKVIDTGNGRS